MASKRRREPNMSENENSDSDTENKSSTNEKVSSKKFSGASTYRVKFNDEWKKRISININISINFIFFHVGKTYLLATKGCGTSLCIAIHPLTRTISSLGKSKVS